MPDHSESLATQVSQLCAQLAEGDVAALGRLFDLTATRLVRYAETISGRREDAEDALQAAMIKLAQHPERLAQAEMPWALSSEKRTVASGIGDLTACAFYLNEYLGLPRTLIKVTKLIT